VARPGAYEINLDDQLSLQQALNLASGAKDWYWTRTLLVSRVDPEGEPTNYRLPLRDILAGELGEARAMPGDVLRVEHNGVSRFQQILAEVFRITVSTRYP
jgi:hypothetical protein